jgi:uncharacterized protein (DUF362 family)
MKIISRRSFIGGSIVAVAAMRYTPVLAADAVDIVDVTGKDPLDRKKMVVDALDALGGIGKFVKKGDFVVLKANAGFAAPVDWGVTTHPDTVAAVAEACLNAKAKRVLLVEFPQGKGMLCLERCGVKAALEKLKVEIKLLGPDDFQKVDVKKGVALKSVELSKDILSADVVINIPTAKAHNETGVSLALKNNMGLIRDRQAFHTQLDLQQAIADLATVASSHLVIVDGTRALLTNGPAGPGETSTPCRIIAGKAIASVDAYALGLARFNGKNLTAAGVRHIMLAGELGLGQTDVSKLKVKKIG